MGCQSGRPLGFEANHAADTLKIPKVEQMSVALAAGERLCAVLHARVRHPGSPDGIHLSATDVPLVPLVPLVPYLGGF